MFFLSATILFCEAFFHISWCVIANNYQWNSEKLRECTDTDLLPSTVSCTNRDINKTEIRSSKHCSVVPQVGKNFTGYLLIYSHGSSVGLNVHPSVLFSSTVVIIKVNDTSRHLFSNSLWNKKHCLPPPGFLFSS